MKKRYYLVATIFLMFLLFLVFAFADKDDVWVECKEICSPSYCPLDSSGTSKCCKANEQESTTNKYCCTDGTNYYWQTGECPPKCTDSDGDYYIAEATDVTTCGNVCGPGKNEPCVGNNDCNDDAITKYQLLDGCLDADGDGYGTGSLQKVCSGATLPPTHSTVCDDCDDRPNGEDEIPGNADDGENINPGASDANCDLIDQDCSGTPDEDYISFIVPCGIGACASASYSFCDDGIEDSNCIPGTPAANDATCNGIDDDCDGSIDEDFVSTQTTCGVGACTSTGSTSCVAGSEIDSCVEGTPAAEICDSTDSDCDGLTDCQDPDCAGSISGNVQDADTTNAISGARIDAVQDATPKYTEFTQASGNYQIDDVLCGPYGMIASAEEYVSSTQAIELQPNQQLENVDFTLTLGTTCEADCTYAGDNTIHKECDGINGCDFCDARSKEVCDLAQPGWIRNYDENNVVECGEGCPYEKKEVKAKITCEEENLIKITKLVQYKGKLTKLVVVACG